MLSIVFLFRWQRSWGIAHRCSQLHSLGRLVQQRPEVLKNVKGISVACFIYPNIVLIQRWAWVFCGKGALVLLKNAFDNCKETGQAYWKAGENLHFKLLSIFFKVTFTYSVFATLSFYFSS